MSRALEIFGIDEWEIQTTYNNCTTIIETVDSVLSKAGESNKDLSDLRYFFDSEIVECFNEEAEKRIGAIRLEDIGETLKNIMLVKTLVTLNSQSVLERIGLNKFGLEGIEITEWDDITDIVRKGSLNNVYDLKFNGSNEKWNEASKMDADTFKRIFEEACVDTLAEILTDSELCADDWDYSMIKLKKERVIKESISEYSDSDLTIKDVCRAIYNDCDCMKKIIDEIDESTRKTKEELLLQEME